MKKATDTQERPVMMSVFLFVMCILYNIILYYVKCNIANTVFI